MGAYEKLVVEGKRACDALAAVTPWSRDAWAKSIRALDRAGLIPAVSMVQVLQITRRTGLDPEAVAELIVREAEAIREAEGEAGP